MLYILFSHRRKIGFCCHVKDQEGPNLFAAAQQCSFKVVHFLFLLQSRLLKVSTWAMSFSSLPLSYNTHFVGTWRLNGELSDYASPLRPHFSFSNDAFLIKLLRGVPLLSAAADVTQKSLLPLQVFHDFRSSINGSLRQLTADRVRFLREWALARKLLWRPEKSTSPDFSSLVISQPFDGTSYVIYQKHRPLLFQPSALSLDSLDKMRNSASKTSLDSFRQK